MSQSTKNPTIDSLIEKSIESYTLADHPKTVQQVMHVLGLTGYFKRFQEIEHISDGVRKFHTPELAINQTLNVYEGALWSQLPTHEIKAAVLAALFQDWMHPQGYFTSDVSNVRSAVSGLIGIHEALTKNLQVSDKCLELATEIIRHTSRPYSASRPVHIQGGRIVRDAWNMWMYRADVEWCLGQMLGLLNESNGQYQDIGPNTFRQRLATDYSSSRWLTTWGNVKAFKMNWPQRAKDLDALFQKSVRHDQFGFYTLAREEPVSAGIRGQA